MKTQTNKAATLKTRETNSQTSEDIQTDKLKVVQLPNSYDLLGYPQNVTALLAAHKFSGEICTFVVNAIEAIEDDQFRVELKNELHLFVNKPGNAIQLVRGDDVLYTVHFFVLP